MYYIVNFENKKYASKALYKAAFGVGDAGLVKQNVLTILFNDVVASLTKEQLDVVQKITHFAQDVDAQLANIMKVSGDPVDVVAIPALEAKRVFTYKKHRFVLLSDVQDYRKYRLMHRLPTLRVCGSIYVALDAVDKTEAKPLVLKETR